MLSAAGRRDHSKPYFSRSAQKTRCLLSGRLVTQIIVVLSWQSKGSVTQVRCQLYLSVNFPFRSPSPEPIYSNDGKRMNTREYRKRRELEETRHDAVQKMLKINPDFKPPTDYK